MARWTEGKKGIKDVLVIDLLLLRSKPTLLIAYSLKIKLDPKEHIQMANRYMK